MGHYFSLYVNRPKMHENSIYSTALLYFPLKTTSSRDSNPNRLFIIRRPLRQAARAYVDWLSGKWQNQTKQNFLRVEVLKR
jgi:hypothetical protein